MAFNFSSGSNKKAFRSGGETSTKGNANSSKVFADDDEE
eukprot:CAMPEP_0116105898 /NCGR_PEP_ID=MMETSP0327-20121206/15316_1 /TAXON_ID=44447 /ORGANISM="Pseudo-nitzschia delicatissima, Strain B596" /LENGTH=38 /DNA_ID= /DNA_START= /DNA_END= /DNA_ORIENTATION=